MAVKTRRAAATRTQTPRLPAKQPGIAAFTRVGKAGAQVVSTKDTLSLKRKLEEPAQSCPSVDEKPAKRSKTEETLPSQAGSQIENTNRQVPVESSSSTSSSNPGNSSQRPPKFSDLVDLNAAFLGALSLHFSHNGQTAPSNLRELAQSTERIWKKRKVDPQDILRVLYIHGVHRPPTCVTKTSDANLGFKLTNYGANTFLEMQDGSIASSVLKERELKAEFLAKLEYYWETSVESSCDSDKQSFIEKIPLAPIQPSKASSKASGNGGQRTIDQLFGALKSKPILTREPPKILAPLKNSVSTSNRRAGLLERMKMKALHQSKLPPPPSKEVLIQRTAVSRLPEVISILLLLSPPAPSTDSMAGRPASLRKSYTMDSITQQIQDSMRTPASKQEIQACIDILSRSRVAIDWVTIVTTNLRQSVVLRSDRRPSPAEINKESMGLTF